MSLYDIKRLNHNKKITFSYLGYLTLRGWTHSSLIYATIFHYLGQNSALKMNEVLDRIYFEWEEYLHTTLIYVY